MTATLEDEEGDAVVTGTGTTTVRLEDASEVLDEEVAMDADSVLDAELAVAGPTGDGMMTTMLD
ncbi:hypothetical protein LTR16_004304, partial [Cryomyces antarcticus]